MVLDTKMEKQDGKLVNMVAAHFTMHTFVGRQVGDDTPWAKAPYWRNSRDRVLDKLGMDKGDATTFGWVEKEKLEVRTGSVLPMQPTAC